MSHLGILVKVILLWGGVVFSEFQDTAFPSVGTVQHLLHLAFLLGLLHLFHFRQLLVFTSSVVPDNHHHRDGKDTTCGNDSDKFC